MARLETPAGRLHAYLAAYAGTALATRTIGAAWATALSIKPDDLPAALAEIGALVPATREAVVRSGEPELLALHDDFSGAWSAPILHPQHSLAGNSTEVLNRQAIRVLGSLAVTLSLTSENEGVVPDADQLARTTAMVTDALGAVMTDPDLDADIRHIVALRLTDIVWAMEHVSLAGPAGVKAATERLAGAVAVAGPRARLPVVVRALEAAGAAWWAFTALPDAQQSIDAWVTMLPIGQ